MQPVSQLICLFSSIYSILKNKKQKKQPIIVVV